MIHKHMGIMEMKTPKPSGSKMQLKGSLPVNDYFIKDAKVYPYGIQIYTNDV